MKNFKSYFITGLLLLLTAIAMAQDNSIALVNVMPPSPNAAALGKFGNTPVGYFTGLPNISVPLFEVKSGKLKVPVNISYHPSGIRVEEVASWVGLGWGLDFGGVISRNVRGIGDEESNGYMNLNGNLTTNQLLANPSTINAQQQLINAAKGIVDNEADVFSFNMGGVSGKFVYNQEAGQFYTIPRMDLKIQYTNPDGFVLTTADGNTYHFTVKETTTTQPICSPATANSSTHTSSWYLSSIISADKKDTVSFTYVPGNYTYSTRGTETKYILEAFSGGVAPGAHAPDYTYSLCTTDITINYQRISRIRFKNGSLNFNTATATRCDLADSVLDNVTMNDLKGRVLNKWQFSYSYFGASGTPSPCNGVNTSVRLKLNSVQQQSSLNGTLVQQNPYLFTYNEDTLLPDRLSFSQDYWGFYNAKATNTTLIPSYIFPSSSGPLYFAGADRSVDSIACKAGILQQITYPTLGTTTYRFESNRINDTTLVPPALHNQAALFGDNAGVITSYDTTFTINETANAYNGYHPGGGALVSFSFGDIGCDISGGASTCANLSLVGVSSGTIGFSVNTPVDHRYLPNGTYKLTATFAQTPPEFGDFYFMAKWDSPDTTVGNLRLTGGLRVQTIADYDGMDHTKDIIRNFKYTQQSDSTISSGTVNGLPQVNNYITPNFGTFFLSIDESTGAQYTYTRYFTKLLSYSNQPYIETQGNYTSYNHVTVYNGENGKTDYNYTQVPDQIDPVAPFESTSNEYARGLLTAQVDYRKTVGTYLPVSRKVNTYTRKSLPAAVLSAGLKLFTSKVSVGFLDNDFVPVYAAYTDTCTWIGLSKTIETTYPNTDTVNTATSVKELSYSPNHYFTASEKITSSRGDTVITAYTYPPDYIGLTATDHLSAGIENLNSNYVINTPVETIAQRKTAASGESNYAILRSYQSARPLPDTVWRTEFTSPVSSFAASGVTSGAATKSSAYAPRIAFSYESIANNIAEQSKIDGPHDAYIWDYKHEYPIASVTNARSADIAYASFEADGGGNWAIASALRDSTKALTGSKCYNLTSGNVSISGLNSSTTYIVSYWSWSSTGSNSYSVTNGGTPTAGTKLGHWAYYQHTVTGTASITVSGAGPIDELRLYPLGAQMTTYTYSPLVGITTSSDAKGQPTYYEYDNLQRLINIKDLHGNIVKNFCYNYAGQASSGCTIPTVYSSIAESGTFTKNDSPPGYAGTAVTYTVPAGAYTSLVSQADANSQAINDVNTNGQAYANTHGTSLLIYYSAAASGTFTRASCSSGYQPTTVTYNVPVGTYTSTISQADADSKAAADISANGQAYANSNAGGCLLIYYSAVQSGSFTRNNCGAGYQPTSVTYTVSAGSYTSVISQADADSKAVNDVNTNGQAYANNNAGCQLIYYSAAQSGTFTRNNCGGGYQPTSVTYNVPAGSYNSVISQADADSKAVNDVNTNGQTYANNNAGCQLIYYNAAQSGSFTRNNCGGGYQPTSVTYTVAAGSYNSVISQADADSKAVNDVNANGQAYANNYAGCQLIYYSTLQSGAFTRNNCGSGYEPTTVTYYVAAGSYTSLISQADADSKAVNDVNTNGQNYANTNAGCQLIYYNSAVSGNFTRNNCGSGYAGTTVTYTIAANSYSSVSSQANADAQALDALNANGQNYANSYGSCQLIYYSAALSQTYTKNDCGSGYIGSSVTYNVPANAYSTTISQAYADNLAANDQASNGQNYANANGSCTQVFYNVTQSGNFTKNDCSGGYVASTVTYTIAANSYSSTVSQADADNQAISAVNAGGQAYANTNGTCTFCGGGNAFRIINNNCEQGAKIYTSSVLQSPGHYLCTYHYQWSDGSTSINYTENNTHACAI